MIAKKTLSAVAVVMSALLGTPLAAQADGPSYEETIAFITQKTGVQSRGTGPSRYTWTQSVTFPQRCRMRVSGETRLPDGRFVEGTEALVDLASLDPTKSAQRAVPGGSDALFQAREGKKIVRHSWIVSSSVDARLVADLRRNHKDATCDAARCRAQFMTEALTISSYAPLADNVPRVVKAVNHLIALCGGKGELF